MTRFRWVSFFALLLALSSGEGESRAQAPSPVQSWDLMMGVVRSDGILLPLASREIQGWTVLRMRIENMVQQPDEASRRVARFIVQLTQALEAECNSLPPRSEREAVPLNDRGRVPVQITTLARDRLREYDHYYFEARKRYAAVEFYANGWLTSSPFSISVMHIDAGIYAGGETSRRQGRVLGVLRVLQSSVWVMEMRGYEGDSYDVVEMPSGEVLSISGGGC